MKINSIIDCINKAVNTESFFVLHINKNKTIGNYYKYVYTIYLCDKEQNKEYLSKEFAVQIKDNEEVVREDLDKSFLTLFLTQLINTKY